MSDFFVDHGCTLYPTAYMSVPVGAGSFPQDGDGTVYGGGAAPAVSVATMDFTGATAAAGATFGVHGATLTCVASAANTTQFNAGAGATLATNLATAINAATVSPTVTTGGAASPYLKALVWAVASGAVLTVYSRIASVSLNQSVNGSCVLICGATVNWTAPPATTNFAGGVSGPWSMFFNPAALTANISSTIGGAGTYGGVVLTMMGVPANGDSIHVRTKRSAANITLAWPSSSLTVLTRGVGTLSLPLSIVFDNGIKWSGDAGVFVMTMDASLSANRSFMFQNVAGLKQIWKGVRLTESTCNWRLELLNVPVTANYFVIFGPAATNANFLEVDGIEVSGASGGYINNTNSAHPYFFITPPLSSSYPRDTPGLVVRNFVFKSKGQKSPFRGPVSPYRAYIYAENSVLDHTGLTSASDEAIIISNVAAGDGKFEAVGCQWVGFPAAANLSGVQKFATKQMMVKLKDCTHPNIKISGGVANGGLVGAAEDLSNSFSDTLRSITVVSSIGNRPFTFENSRRSFSWFDSSAPRTTSSVLPDGVTNFSVRTAVTTESGNVAPWAPVLFPRLAKHNSLASGTCTATLRLLVDNNLRTALGARDPKNHELWITIGYIGTDLLYKSVTTRAEITDTPVSIPSGVALDWSAVSYDVNGVTHNYTPFAISVSCPNMQTLTEASLVVGQGFQGTSVDDLIFLDPEWALV